MKPQLTIIPCASLHPGQLNIYNEIKWDPGKPSQQKQIPGMEDSGPKYQHLLESDRSAKGKVSAIAKRKILRALKYLLLMANEKTIHNIYTGRMFKFKIAFITLTLPSQQIHDDNQIKSELLNQFLIELRKFYKVKNYIWRAEKQKNGNLHFHIIVDKFIPQQELRDRWNRIINKLGYVDRYREAQKEWHKNGFRVRKELLKTWPKEKQLAAYKRGQKINWNSPNTTDIHSVQKIHNVKQYIAKYLTKEEIEKVKNENPTSEITEQKGRIWSCSSELSNVKGAQMVLDSQITDEIEELIESGEVKLITDKYYSIVFFDMALILKKPNSQLYKLFSKFMIEKFDFNIQIEFPFN